MKKVCMIFHNINENFCHSFIWYEDEGFVEASFLKIWKNKPYFSVFI